MVVDRRKSIICLYTINVSFQGRKDEFEEKDISNEREGKRWCIY